MKYAIIFLTFGVFANEVEFKSGNKKVHLLELYTSESCSSCPPAEAWMNSFKSHPKLWKEFVPVEFHVDYWNYLSWVDKYSQKKYSQRQRKYHQTLGAGVYTPQYILNAKDWRKWHQRKLPSDSNSKAPELVARIDTKTGEVTISIATSQKNLFCNAVLMGGGVSSKVKAGENKGKTLPHEFAVLNYTTEKLNKGKCKLKLNLNERDKANSHSVAFWINDKDSFQVIQATGGNF